jgi:hypothetical protein
MLAYDVSADSSSGCEVRARLDNVAEWQARSMIVRQDAMPKIHKKLMALALGLLLGLPGLARAATTFTFTTIDVPLPPPPPNSLSPDTEVNANSPNPNTIAGQYSDLGGGAIHGFILSGSAYTTIDAPNSGKIKPSRRL